MRVKICGIANVKDAKIAEAAGADAIGVILCSDSPRAITFGKAAEIFSSLGPYTATVCVSHTKSEKDLENIAELKPSAIQIYFNIDIPEERSFKLLRTLKPSDPLRDDCDAVVVDESMGTGKKCDYEYAKKVVETSKVPVILAGGLTPKNVREAIKVVRPYGVDVSSGVESRPGIKDPKKVRAFVEACKDM